MYHQKLDIWTRSYENTKLIYASLSTIKRADIFDLKNQIYRCSVSIPSNIAEGSARDSKKEFARFLAISLGSFAELSTQLSLLEDIMKVDLQKIINENNEISKMIAVFRRKLLVNEKMR